MFAIMLWFSAFLTPKDFYSILLSNLLNFNVPGVDFTKSRKSKINRKCDFQAFDWLKFTLTTDLGLTTFCEINH